MNLITSDEYKPYRELILKAYGEEIVPERTRSTRRLSQRQNGTDRGRYRRKTRKTYCFSKHWDIHGAVTYLTDHVWSLWEWLTFPVVQRE